jgi:hydroxyacylglutathione hydrolase
VGRFESGLATDFGREIDKHEAGLADGDVMKLGNVELSAVHKPGHTPEHVSMVVVDRARGATPWRVRTGHTLMVGDMGRKELAASAEAGARELFRSARRLRGLPDHVEVLPGAFSGSVRGRGLSWKAFSPNGFAPVHDLAFADKDEASFVRVMLNDTPPRPAHAEEIRALNLGTAPSSP